MLFHLPLAFPQIEFRTRTRTMRWDLLLPANTKFRGQVYSMIPLALSTACYKIVKIRSSDKISNPNAVAAVVRSECKAFRLDDPFLYAAVIRT
jgi:hypothetical protein